MFEFLKKKLKKSVDKLKEGFSSEKKEQETSEKKEESGLEPGIQEESGQEQETPEEFEEAKRELEEEKEDLEEEKAELEEEKAELEEEKEDLEEEKAELEEDSEKAEELEKEISEEESDLEAIDELEESVEESGPETPEKEVEKEVLEEVEDEIEKDLEEDKEELEETQEDIEEGKEDVEEAQEEVHEAQEEVHEAQEDVEEAREEVHEAQEEVKEAREEVHEAKEELEEAKPEEEKTKPKKKSFLSRVFKKKPKPKPKETSKKKSKPEVSSKQTKPTTEPEKGFFGKVSGALFEKEISEKDFEKFFKTIEIAMLQANIAYGIIDLIKQDLKEKLVGKKVKRSKIENIINDSLKKVFGEILIEKDPETLIEAIEANKKENEPTSFLFLGVNGVGKTTNMAKLAYWLQQKGYSCVFAASDTFRAASIEQLEKHGSNLGIKVIKHKYGADAAAVAFDAIQHAKAKKIDCVLIDSAGRQHTNTNLMEELKKLERVAKPSFRVFVADSMTGNDAVEQAQMFNEKVGFDWSILAKADVDTKGGAILSVSYISKKPIAFLGVGQEYKDLEPFNKDKIVEKIGV